MLSMFALDDDPRFDGLDATIAARTDVHVALGGPEDACGGGYVAIDTKGHMRGVGIYGERFAQGDADVSLHWYDRQRGIAGADVDVRSFVLDKVQPPTGTRPRRTGTLLCSVSTRRGSEQAVNVVMQGYRCRASIRSAPWRARWRGASRAWAHVTGNLDDFQPDAGLVARAQMGCRGHPRAAERRAPQLARDRENDASDAPAAAQP